MDAFYAVAKLLPVQIADIIQGIQECDARQVTEICLRSGRPVVLMMKTGIRFLKKNSELSEYPDENSVFISHVFLQNCFQALCGYSVHCYARQIQEGFIPLQGGHRAGICGTMYVDGSGRRTVKNITSLNIRIARIFTAECDIRLQKLLQRADVGLLIAGEPGSGKTTVLRAIIETLSRFGKKTAVVDERFEIAPADTAGFVFPVPVHCDVLSGYPKHIGMQHALRTLSPQVMICDEVGTMEEISSIAQAANAGVGVVATIHASGLNMLKRRPQYRELLKTGAFTHLAVMKGRAEPGIISEVYDAEDSY